MLVDHNFSIITFTYLYYNVSNEEISSKELIQFNLLESVITVSVIIWDFNICYAYSWPWI